MGAGVAVADVAVDEGDKTDEALFCIRLGVED